METIVVRDGYAISLGKGEASCGAILLLRGVISGVFCDICI